MLITTQSLSLSTSSAFSLQAPVVDLSMVMPDFCLSCCMIPGKALWIHDDVRGAMPLHKHCLHMQHVGTSSTCWAACCMRNTQNAGRALQHLHAPFIYCTHNA